MARQLLRHWHVPPGDEFPGSPEAKRKGTPPTTSPAGERNAALLKLIERRRKVLSDAWLTHIGHKRPGMAKGVAVEEARRQAEGLALQIDQTLAQEN